MERIKILDVARGLAIIGTLGTNIWIFGSAHHTMEVDEAELSIIGPYISNFTDFLTNGKFLGLLTIMFGIGMQLKYISFQNRELPWFRLYLWSMILLFIDGLLHFIFVFEFDVLMSYSLTGILVAFIIQRSERIMKICMFCAGATHVLYQVGQGFINEIMSSKLARMLFPNNPYANIIAERNLTEQALIRYENQLLDISAFTWWEQVVYRMEHFWVLRSEAIMILPMNVFLFLLGVFLVRKGLLEMDARGIRLQKRLLWIGLGIGIPINALSIFNVQFIVFDRYVFAPILSLGYLGLVFLIARHQKFVKTQQYISNVGKMALTCYITQNIVSSFLFYNWGLGLSKHYNPLLIYTSWLGITLFMIGFSTLWLQKYKQGPVETIWRKLGNIPVNRYKQKLT
ncbi:MULTISPECIES: DUF418 domain-containing protein [unclassified Lysinibacillus]|uniref:DUF418 domain-containing protein n=1 Tax=unclassified Lysinibacillus TaxID=2636778 RepID=UPI003824EC9E